MAEKYKQLLNYIYTRYQQGIGSLSISGQIASSIKPTEVERHFLDFLRIVIEGGWVVQDKEEWISIIDFVEAGDEIESNPQTQRFFQFAADIYGFSQEFEQSYLICED